MKVGSQHFRTIWLASDERTVKVIDQRKLPFEFALTELRTVADTAFAIREMMVRGAGLIGATAGFGMLLAALEAERMDRQKFLAHVQRAGDLLIQTRPTAINLAWAVKRQIAAMNQERGSDQMVLKAMETAQAIADEDAEACRQIGFHGVSLIREISRWLARVRGFRVRDSPNLRGVRRRDPGSCLGGRDPSPKPGFAADCLGTWSTWRTTHRDR